MLTYCRSILKTLPNTAKNEVQLILDEIDGNSSPDNIEKETLEKLKELKKANKSIHLTQKRR